jgi:hypothetical protein
VVYKNGSEFKRMAGFCATGNSQVDLRVSFIDNANGTDFYEAYGYADGAGNKTISGLARETYFEAHTV